MDRVKSKWSSITSKNASVSTWRSSLSLTAVSEKSSGNAAPPLSFVGSFTTVSCGADPHQTYRQMPSGEQLVYRFDLVTVSGDATLISVDPIFEDGLPFSPVVLEWAAKNERAPWLMRRRRSHCRSSPASRQFPFRAGDHLQ